MCVCVVGDSRRPTPRHTHVVTSGPSQIRPRRSNPPPCTPLESHLAVARLKALRLEAKRERAILGVKRDVAEKEEAVRLRQERLRESVAREEGKKGRMAEIRGRAVARMEVSILLT